MRRVMILILLGIIIYSTITSHNNSTPRQETHRVIIDTVRGFVSAGNFSYWTSGQNGPLYIELFTLSGDADLFIGDSPRPSYEPDRNNFSSETCGPDIIRIPKEFPRPIGIAVFGHWSYPISEFYMKVYIEMLPKLNVSNWNSPSSQTASGTSAERVLGRDSASAQKEATNEYESKDPEQVTAVFGWKESELHRFYRLFRILDNIFEYFIL